MVLKKKKMVLHILLNFQLTSVPNSSFKIHFRQSLTHRYHFARAFVTTGMTSSPTAIHPRMLDYSAPETYYQFFVRIWKIIFYRLTDLFIKKYLLVRRSKYLDSLEQRILLSRLNHIFYSDHPCETWIMQKKGESAWHARVIYKEGNTRLRNIQIYRHKTMGTLSKSLNSSSSFSINDKKISSTNFRTICDFRMLQISSTLFHQ